jgi:hypothetical protein
MTSSLRRFPIGVRCSSLQFRLYPAQHMRTRTSGSRPASGSSTQHQPSGRTGKGKWRGCKLSTRSFTFIIRATEADGSRFDGYDAPQTIDILCLPAKCCLSVGACANRGIGEEQDKQEFKSRTIAVVVFSLREPSSRKINRLTCSNSRALYIAAPALCGSETGTCFAFFGYLQRLSGAPQQSRCGDVHDSRRCEAAQGFYRPPIPPPGTRFRCAGRLGPPIAILHVHRSHVESPIRGNLRVGTARIPQPGLWSHLIYPPWLYLIFVFVPV